MSTAIAKVSTASIGAVTDEQVSLIKRTICKGATDDELALFVATANRLGLEPFARQIFAVKRGGVMSIQVSIDGFRVVADRTGKYAPGRPTEYEHDDTGKLVAATAYVKKHVAGEWHEIGETSYLSEYQQSSNQLWKTMPRVMLAKTAEARALRRAFPAELSGVYADAEMDQAVEPRPAQAFKAPELVDAEIVEGPPTKAAADAIMAAASMAELEAASAAITQLGLKKDSAERKELGKLYKAKKTQLERLAEEVEPDVFDDPMAGAEVA